MRGNIEILKNFTPATLKNKKDSFFVWIVLGIVVFLISAVTIWLFDLEVTISGIAITLVVLFLFSFFIGRKVNKEVYRDTIFYNGLIMAAKEFVADEKYRVSHEYVADNAAKIIESRLQGVYKPVYSEYWKKEIGDPSYGQILCYGIATTVDDVHVDAAKVKYPPFDVKRFYLLKKEAERYFNRKSFLLNARIAAAEEITGGDMFATAKFLSNQEEEEEKQIRKSEDERKRKNTYKGFQIASGYCPYCFKKIPRLATKCPHCTADL